MAAQPLGINRSRSSGRIAGLGSSGASYLNATLTHGERIGVASWSQTLLSVADRLGPLRTCSADRVVQLVSGIGAARAQAKWLLSASRTPSVPP